MFKLQIERIVQIMDTKEDNSRQGNLNSSNREAQCVVELNSDLMKTMEIRKADLQSFKDDNMNEIKE